MHEYVLLAILILGPIEQEPVHCREATWSAVFSSIEKCDAAASALGKKFNSEPGAKYVQIVDYVCVEK